jgi:hypothetical protein
LGLGFLRFSLANGLMRRRVVLFRPGALRLTVPLTPLSLALQLLLAPVAGLRQNDVVCCPMQELVGLVECATGKEMEFIYLATQRYFDSPKGVRFKHAAQSRRNPFGVGASVKLVNAQIFTNQLVIPTVAGHALDWVVRKSDLDQLAYMPPVDIHTGIYRTLAARPI